MNMNLNNLILILSIIMGTSSNSLLMLWLTLEINAPMFSMMMSQSKEKPQCPINYFIIQTIPSMIMLLLLILNLALNENMDISPELISNCLLMIPMMKMGMIPFHNWMMFMVKNLKKLNLIILLSLQKILPLKITSLLKPNLTTLLITMINLTIPCMMITQSTLIPNILMASSLFNISWMIPNLNMSIYASIMYFTIYSILTTQLIMTLSKTNIKSTNQTPKALSLKLSLAILAMSGLPPTWSFMNKVMMTQSMMKLNSPKLLILTMITSSIFMLTGYMKISFSTMLLNAKTMKKIKLPSPWILSTNLIPPLMILSI